MTFLSADSRRTILVVAQLNYVVVWVIDIERDTVAVGAPAFSRTCLDAHAHSDELILEFFHVCRFNNHAEMIQVLHAVPVNWLLVGTKEVDNGVGVDACRRKANLPRLPFVHTLGLESQNLSVKLEGHLYVLVAQNDVVHLGDLDQCLGLFRGLDISFSSHGSLLLHIGVWKVCDQYTSSSNVRTPQFSRGSE